MTVKEYLEQLPEPERGQALKNMDKEKAGDQVKSLEHAIYCAFRWHRSREGFEHWAHIHHRVKYNETA